MASCWPGERAILFPEASSSISGGYPCGAAAYGLCSAWLGLGAGAKYLYLIMGRMVQPFCLLSLVGGGGP